MPSFTPAEFLDRLQIVATIKPEPVAIVAEQPDGPTIPLSEYRNEMEQSRLESVGEPGLFYDSSTTGSGKSTADIAAFQIAGRSLCLQPTHDNSAEVVQDCLAAGLFAAALPGRFSAGEKQNCWNTAADAAQTLGFNAVAAVCNAGCEQRGQCAQSGYLAEVEAATAARVAVGTHARAVHTGLASLSKGRDFIAVHEDSLDVLVPQMAVSAGDLLAAQTVLNRLLTDPEWLNRFGEAFTLDSDGETWIPDERRTERRDQQYQFCLHLANVTDRLIELAEAAEKTAELSVGEPVKEPPGVQPLLFELSQESAGDFIDKEIWPLLFAVASGRFYTLGVVINERNRDNAETKSGRQNDRPDSEKSTAAGCDRVAG
ncbi:MAG: hypothetical protein HQ518_11235 [Rhodopirellula sp.]|nr:hypothetical protein [Rhodopirellula sp.]